MDLELRGRRVLITGASRGIGRAIAQVLAEEGCNLELAARSAEALETAAAELRATAGARVVTHAVDLSRSDDQQRLARDCGSVDILGNNAGANPHGEIEDIAEAVWRGAWDLKVFGFINLIRLYLPLMKARGSGVIVNVIGNAGERLNVRYVLGSAGNAGRMALTRALGSRSPDGNVRVVGVNPGSTATDRALAILRQRSQERFGTPDRVDDIQREMNLPFGRMGTPREVAELVAFLASPRASYISGTIVTIDGGATHRNA